MEICNSVRYKILIFNNHRLNCQNFHLLQEMLMFKGYGEFSGVTDLFKTIVNSEQHMDLTFRAEFVGDISFWLNIINLD